jgi:hypothetical protein
MRGFDGCDTFPTSPERLSRVRSVRKSMKGVVGAGLLGGLAFAAWRAFVKRAGERSRGVEWESAPFPFPPVPRPAGSLHASAGAAAPTLASSTVASSTGAAAWTEPLADGSCPPTHPVKAKLSSGIFHVPGGLNYERTRPDRCYLDEAAAEADGLRPSKV